MMWRYISKKNTNAYLGKCRGFQSYRIAFILCKGEGKGRSRYFGPARFSLTMTLHSLSIIACLCFITNPTQICPLVKIWFEEL